MLQTPFRDRQALALKNLLDVMDDPAAAQIIDVSSNLHQAILEIFLVDDWNDELQYLGLQQVLCKALQYQSSEPFVEEWRPVFWMYVSITFELFSTFFSSLL